MWAGLLQTVRAAIVISVGIAAIAASEPAACAAIIGLLNGAGISALGLNAIGATLAGSMVATMGYADATQAYGNIYYGLLGSDDEVAHIIIDNIEFLRNAPELYYLFEAMVTLGTAEAPRMFEINYGIYLSNRESNILEKASYKNKEDSNTKYGNQIKVSDQKMYQQGQHYNKHGKDMGYGSKKDYEAGARNFIENNKSTADIFEGQWNSSRGGQSGEIQIIIRADGKQAIINKATEQIIDFKERFRENDSVIEVENARFGIAEDNCLDQIGVQKGFAGKYKKCIGIGSTLQDIKNYIGEYILVYDIYELEQEQGICFELEDIDDWNELTAPIEFIYVFRVTKH